MTAALIDKAERPVTIVPQAKMTAIITLDNTTRAATAELAKAEESGSDIQRAMATSYGMQRILDAFTPEILSDLCRLQGTKLGFRTDKDTSGGYRPEQIKPVLAEAMLRGLQVVGNHINVIAGNLYVTKEGFEYLLSRLPGLTDLKVQVGVPTNSNGGALVPAKASWKMNGVANSMTWEDDYRIPIRVNSSMGVDAVIGKAKSKVLRQVYSCVTGTTLLAEGDDEVAVEVVADEPAKDA